MREQILNGPCKRGHTKLWPSEWDERSDQAEDGRTVYPPVDAMLAGPACSVNMYLLCALSFCASEFDYIRK